MSETAGIVVDGVSRSFGPVRAVQRADLVAAPGRVTGLIGPNGSGKTTLMLMLASLLAPDTGRILIDGHDPVTDAASVRRALGWMPDALGSWGALSVRTTLEVTARLYRMPKDASRARAEELVHLVDLRELADQPTRVLSRGQKQRLSLARALVHGPSVLVLDEPASGLDPGARMRLRDLVRDFAARGGTVLVSSHVLAELDEMADDIVYVDAGVTMPPDAVRSARATARPWRIRVVEGDARAALVAAGVDPTTIAVDRGELVVPIAGDDAAARLLAELVTRGIRISAYSPAVAELEHAFVDLGRAARLERGTGL